MPFGALMEHNAASQVGLDKPSARSHERTLTLVRGTELCRKRDDAEHLAARPGRPDGEPRLEKLAVEQHLWA